MQSVDYALQPTLEVESSRMQWEGILEHVKRNEWATPLVVVQHTKNQCVEAKTYIH